VVGQTGVKRRWKKMVCRMPTVDWKRRDQRKVLFYTHVSLPWFSRHGGVYRYCDVPLTTSLTLVRSATISSTYSGGRRASMVKASVDGLID
jgi:hypothetical protein